MNAAKSTFVSLYMMMSVIVTVLIVLGVTGVAAAIQVHSGSREEIDVAFDFLNDEGNRASRA